MLCNFFSKITQATTGRICNGKRFTQAAPLGGNYSNPGEGFLFNMLRCGDSFMLQTCKFTLVFSSPCPEYSSFKLCWAGSSVFSSNVTFSKI